MADTAHVSLVDNQVARYLFTSVFIEFEYGHQSVLDVCHGFGDGIAFGHQSW